MYELADHAYKLDVKLAEFVWEWFFGLYVILSVCCAHACQALPLRSELINNTLRNQRWDTFFYLNFECHNRYKKLLMSNSENSDMAWWTKNNSECLFFLFSLRKEQNLVS